MYKYYALKQYKHFRRPILRYYFKKLNILSKKFKNNSNIKIKTPANFLSIRKKLLRKHDLDFKFNKRFHFK